MIITDRDSKGYYTVDGKRYLSVTKHFKKLFGLPEGMVEGMVKKHGSWAMAKVARNEAGNVGTRRHKMFDDYFFKGQINFEIMSGVEQLQKIFDRKGIKPLYGEQKLGSHILKTAGRCDLITKDKKGIFEVADYKSGDERYLFQTNYFIQVSVYAFMVCEMLGLNWEDKKCPIRSRIIGIGKDDTYQITEKNSMRVYTHKQMKEGVEGFKAIQFLLRLKDTYE